MIPKVKCVLEPVLSEPEKLKHKVLAVLAIIYITILHFYSFSYLLWNYQEQKEMYAMQERIKAGEFVVNNYYDKGFLIKPHKKGKI